MYIIFRKSKYLKIERIALLRILRLHLKHRLKKAKEQVFVLRRLKLLDQQYCVTHYRQLWQFYFDLGSKNGMWPVSFKL